MADDKPRAPRARKRTTNAGPSAAMKPAGKKTAAAPRVRTSAAVERKPEDVAVRAYLLWEQGAPGGGADHWLRAGQELAA